MERIILIMMIVLLQSGCSGGISGTVVDAETGNPIEGAVILVEWTKTKGKWLGLKSTESFHVVETLTNKEGKFKVSGLGGPSVNPPDITIYKKGYVAWSSRIIFPDHRNRTNYQFQENYAFRLERFKPEYSYINHTSFIRSATRSAIGNKKLFEEAYRWEEIEASKERAKLRRK